MRLKKAVFELLSLWLAACGSDVNNVGTAQSYESTKSSGTILSGLTGTSIITQSSNSTAGSVTWQGKTYRTTNINGKIWFAENLDYGIQVIARSGQVNNDVVEKSCYNDSAAYCTTYGGLYTWAESMELPANCNKYFCDDYIYTRHQGICPNGWHIPTRDEFLNMIADVGGAYIAGKNLKSKTGWNVSSNGTDNYGFTALPSGMYGIEFLHIFYSLEIWLVDEKSNDGSYARLISIEQSDTIGSAVTGKKNSQRSIRCLKN